MANSTNLQLPLLEAAQAQKHVTVNDALQALDAVVHLAVKDRDLTAPPASPADGERYLVATGATGGWAGQDGKIAAYQDGVWRFYAPREGWRCWVDDENALLIHDGTAWALSLGTAAYENIGTSGSTVPKLDGANTWGATQVFDAATGAALDVNGKIITLDADGDTDISTASDDQIRFRIGGTTHYMQLSRAAGSPQGLFIRFQNGSSTTGTLTQFLAYAKNSSSADVTVAGFSYVYDTNTAGAEDGTFSFNTVQSGTYAARLKFSAGVYHPSASGGDKGNNTINFGAVYDDGVLLTCYGFAQENEGTIDPAEWDGYAPPELDQEGRVKGPGQHRPARDFMARQAGFDQTDPDQYAAFWKANGRFPNLPGRGPGYDHGRDKLSVGASVQKLIEICEMQAIHIEKLNQRLKALEAPAAGRR